MDQIIFLDRDGTLNAEVHYLHRTQDLQILPGVAQALRIFREAGYKLVVVTNQAGVARGYYTEQDVKILHDFMNGQLARENAHIDLFFYCPHHPEYGIGNYKASCRCRKPDIGMFEMAQKFYDVDKAHSWMIGDKLIDIQAGIHYGVHTALVGTGYGAAFHESELEKQKAERDAGKYGAKLPYELYGRRLDELARQIVGWKERTMDVKGKTTKHS